MVSNKFFEKILKSCWVVIFVLPSILWAQQQQGGLSAEEAAKANNPLANSKALNLQNYYVPSIYDDASLKANTMLIRYAAPLLNGRLLMRYTLPLSTVPAGYNPAGKPTYGSGWGMLIFLRHTLFPNLVPRLC